MRSFGAAYVIFLLVVILPAEIVGQQELSFATGEKIGLQRHPTAQPMHPGSIHKKALDKFNRNYPLATSKNWYVLRNGYCVKCFLAGKAYEIFYNNKGQWRYCIKTYGARYFDAALREIAEEHCKGYKVFQVIEIETHESAKEPTYIIQMEGPEQYKELRLHKGDLQTWRQLKKQPDNTEK